MFPDVIPGGRWALQTSGSSSELTAKSYAFTTFPLRRHEAHTRSLLVAPFTLARTGRRLTFQRRLVTLWAWLMLLPNCGPLPQISQTCAMTAQNPSSPSGANSDFTGAGAGLTTGGTPPHWVYHDEYPTDTRCVSRRYPTDGHHAQATAEIDQ